MPYIYYTSRTVFPESRVRSELRYFHYYSRSKYKDVWYHGDLIFVDSDGLWYIQGRTDDVIKVSGHRIGAAEVEAAITSHPAIAEAAAVGIPDEIKGEAITIYATLKTNLPSDYITNCDIIKMKLSKQLKLLSEGLPVQNRSNSSAIFPRPELVNLLGG